MDVETQKETLDRQGYVVIEGALASHTARDYVKRLNNIYSQLKDTGRHLYPGGLGTTERLIMNLHNKDDEFLDLMDHPAVVPLLQHLLMKGSYADSEPYVLNQCSARDPHLGAKAQQLHIDSRFPGPPFALTAIALWMINDFSKPSGSTHVVPGSHRRPAYPETGVAYADEAVVEAPAGSVLVYNGSLWHGGGAKVVDVERWSAVLTYSRWFVKPSMDFTKNTPQALYERLSPARRELFGFTSIPPHNEFQRARARTTIEDLPDVWS